MNYTNPFKRFLLRGDLCKRIKARLVDGRRRLSKNELADLKSLFEGEEPKTIFDVGANVGFMTWQFMKAFRQASIYAFEPDPVPLRVLQKTHGSSPRVRAFPMAAADKEGELAFTQRGISCNSSLLETVTNGSQTQPERTVKVKTCTLDRFCLEQSVPHIDLLKTDTEGADLLVLKGAKEMLSRRAIDVVMSEVLFIPTYKGQAALDEIAIFLRGYGFQFFNLYMGRETDYGQACYGNAIFVGEWFRHERLS